MKIIETNLFDEKQEIKKNKQKKNKKKTKKKWQKSNCKHKVAFFTLNSFY